MNYNFDEIKERESAKQKERDTITDMLCEIDDEKYLKVQLNKYIDMLGEGDARFLKQLCTLALRHLQKTGRR